MSELLFGRRPGPDPRLHLTRGFRPPPKLVKPQNVSYEAQFPPIFTQSFQDCVANAAAACVAFYRHKRSGIGIDPSRAAIYAAAKIDDYSGEEHLADDGLYPSDALEVLKRRGWVPEHLWPYDAAHYLTEPEDAFWKPDVMRGYRSVQPTVSALRGALAAHGPIMVGFEWPAVWDETDAQGRLAADSEGSKIEGGHETVLVGYSDTKGAFRLRNSWGAAWGDAGHAWLPYHADRMPQDAFVLDYAR